MPRSEIVHLLRKGASSQTTPAATVNKSGTKIDPEEDDEWEQWPLDADKPEGVDGINNSMATQAIASAGVQSDDNRIISDKGERIILFEQSFTTHQGLGLRDGKWCHVDKVHAVMSTIYSSAATIGAVVLTAEESDIPLGGLDLEGLNDLIRRFWGPFEIDEVRAMFNCAASLMDAEDTGQQRYYDYDSWLRYFITQDHTYGLVHGWISAMVRLTIDVAKVRKDSSNDWFLWRVSHILYPPVDVHFEPIDGPLAPSFNYDVQLDDNGNKFIPLGGAQSTLISPKLNQYVAPRRFWDICANRVVPRSWYTMTSFGSGYHFTPISHAWVAPEDLQYVTTNVNQQLWPVPLPKGVDLEDIRMELISHGIRYAWLDVVCLRQMTCPPGWSGASELDELANFREQSRLVEWETDVPLIGKLYDGRQVLTYLSGLGRPFRDADWDNPRHWLRRVWTAQETRPVPTKFNTGMHIAGLPNPTRISNVMTGGPTGYPWTCTIDSSGTTLLTAVTRLTTTRQLDTILRDIHSRHASNPVDRISALTMLLRHAIPKGIINWDHLPVYDAHEPLESAWRRLVSYFAALSPLCQRQCCHMRNDSITVQLLKAFPHPSADHWFPSWAQVQLYPHVSLKEPQRLGPPVPGADYPMRLFYGHLYGPCAVWHVPRPPPAPGAGGAHFAQYMAVADGVGNGHPPCEVTLTATVPGTAGVVELTPDAGYLLLDITHSHPPRSFDDVIASDLPEAEMRLPLRPYWERHLLVVCTESTAAPPVGWGEGEGEGEGGAGGQGARGKWKYYLRRVTTLEWQGPEGGWLPFRARMKSRWWNVEEARVRRGGKGDEYSERLLWDGPVGVEVYLQ